MKTPEEERIPVEAGKEQSRPAPQVTAGSGPVPVENNTGRNIQLDIALDECEHIARRLRWLKEQLPPTPDPRIQAVIDAARVLVSETSFSGTSWGTNFTALESALAALGEGTIKQDGQELCECGDSKDYHWEGGSCKNQFCICHQFKSKTKPAEAQARMEGDDFEEWWQKESDGLPLQHSGKEWASKAWHAKANGGGE